MYKRQASFNLIYLFNIALAGFGMFLLARRVTTHDAEAWLAGALFACCGFMVGRSFGHFSLVAAAPLPFFVWCLIRCWERRRTREPWPQWVTATWLVIVAVASAGALAAPVLSAQAFGEAMDAAPVLWRSGPQGADLLALLLPVSYTHLTLPTKRIV